MMGISRVTSNEQVEAYAVDYLIEQIFTRLKRKLDPAHTLGVADEEEESCSDFEESNNLETIDQEETKSEGCKTPRIMPTQKTTKPGAGIFDTLLNEPT